MASSARRDPVRVLALLVRAPEPGTTNLGEFLATHARELAQVLDITPTQLEAASVFDDEEIAPRVRLLLRRARDVNVLRDVERRRQRSAEAADRLGAAARWTDLGAELDVDLLLGELLADRTMKWVSFVDEGVQNVTIPRHLLAATAPLRRVHLDLAAFVDAQGLHFRWRGGRGGYNWRGHDVGRAYAAQILTVPLQPKVVVAQPERRRGGAWLGHILQELGYV